MCIIYEYPVRDDKKSEKNLVKLRREKIVIDKVNQLETKFIYIRSKNIINLIKI